MSYVEKHLIPGETLQYQTRLHWAVMLGHLLIGMLFALAAIVVPLLLRPTPGPHRDSSGGTILFALVCLAVAAILIGLGILKRSATEIAVTNRRVIVKMGVVSRRTLELLLPRIESVGVEESVIGRLLGYGTVTIRGTGGTPEVFEKIAHPLEFRQQVQRQIQGEARHA